VRRAIRIACAAALLCAALYAQQAPPAPAAEPPAATLTPVPSGGAFLEVGNASLTDVIDILARQLKINYILDPRVRGAVTVKTFGELRALDPRALLETVLRVNGAAMVQVGDIYRIVPLTEISRLPMRPQVGTQPIPDDERVSLNLVFLKYATVSELSKLLEKFLGEGATMISYDPANLLLILDNNRNMRRTMELISLFDSDALAGQRVRLFEVRNGSPTDISKELDTIFRSISLGEKVSPVKFMPLERINTIIAVAPNPGVFETVASWLEKLDVPVKAPVGSVDNYVYRVKYGQSDILASAIMQLYMGVISSPGMYSGTGSSFGMGSSRGQFSGVGGQTAAQLRRPGPGTAALSAGGGASQGTQPGGAAATTYASPFDLTGSYLGAGNGFSSMTVPEGMPRVVPNPLDNTLLIQSTPQEYEKILKLLRDLDVPPRQVLIEAKIYEVTLTGAFASGVSAYFQRLNGTDMGSPSITTRVLQAATNAGGLTLTAGALVGNSRQLLGILTASEDNRKTKVISAPVIIATDSVPATINVGQDVPTLTSQAVTGVQQGGSSLFANTVSNRNSGVTLNILARINPSGIVTMVINQEVSSPVAPSANAAIQSPSFSTRFVQTQVTVQDGDTIAIGGIIQETDTSSSAGVPFLHRIPILGSVFGAKSTSKERTELVVFMTPRVIYDTNSITEASEEVKSKLKRLKGIIQD
jgi:general secretion pathway protein D